MILPTFDTTPKDLKSLPFIKNMGQEHRIDREAKSSDALLEKIRNQANLREVDNGVEYHPVAINYGDNSLDEIQPSFESVEPIEPQQASPVKIEEPTVKSKPYKTPGESTYVGLYVFIGLSFLAVFYFIAKSKT